MTDVASNGMRGAVSSRGQRPLRRPKMAVVVAETIAEQILSANVQPGTALATEARMAEQFDVGRATIREALRLLEAQGLIRVRPGPQGGPIVQRPSFDHVTQLLSTVFALSGTSFAEVIDARKLLEPVLAFEAARNASKDEIAEMQASVERQRLALGNEIEFLSQNDEFHSLIARASGTRVLATFQYAMRKMSVGIPMGVHYDEESRAGTLRAHVRIVELISNRDQDHARTSMARHMKALEDYLRARYPALLSGTIRAGQAGTASISLTP